MRVNQLVSVGVASVLASTAAGLRVPVKDVREEKALLAKRGAAQEIKQVFNDLEKRLTCYEDDTLLSLQMYREDSEPFCSAYLGIQNKTTTVTVASKTTISTITATNYNTVDYGTTTVGLTTVTITAAPSAALRRRQDDGITPAASVISSCSESPLNRTLISIVSSGCSCLKITPLTITSTVTTKSIRTINGFDDEDTTVYETSTVPTVTVTVQGTAAATLTIPSIGFPTMTSASTGMMPSMTMPSNTLPGTGMMTSTSAIIPTPPKPTFTQPGRSGGGLTSTTSMSLGPNTATYPDTLPTSLPSGVIPTGIPTGISNLTSALPTAPFAISTSSGALSVTPMGTSMTPMGTSSAAPSTTTMPSLKHCPSDNGTTFTTHCQTFLIECQVEYPGPAEYGLYEPDVYDCILGCATANRGFSQPQCYAITYLPYNQGNNCFFKTKADSELPLPNELAVSALLIDSNACSKNTTSMSSMMPTASASSGFATISMNSTKPTIPVPSITIPVNSRNGFPTSSGTGLPLPTISANISVSANLTIPGTAAATSILPTGLIPSKNLTLTAPTAPMTTGAYSTGMPPFTGNSSMPGPTAPPFTLPSGPSRILPTGAVNSTSVCPYAQTITTTVSSTVTSVVYQTVTVYS